MLLSLNSSSLKSKYTTPRVLAEQRKITYFTSNNTEGPASRDLTTDVCSSHRGSPECVENSCPSCGEYMSYTVSSFHKRGTKDAASFFIELHSAWKFKSRDGFWVWKKLLKPSPFTPRQPVLPQVRSTDPTGPSESGEACTVECRRDVQ